MSSTERLLFIGYNVLWWVPLALALFTPVSYHAGAVLFVATTALRALINVYRINVMPIDAAQRFPLRIP